MNPSGAFWWDLFGRVFVESSVVLGLAAVATRKMSPRQQRKVWQIGLSLLLLLFCVEATGLHQRMHLPSAQAKAEPTTRRVTVQIVPAEAVAVAPMQPAASRPSGTWVPGLAWLAMFGYVAARSFGSRLAFLACRNRRRLLNDSALREQVDALAARMHVRGRIQLSESRLLAGPVAFGFLRRCICVPLDFTRRTSSEQDVMLAHEVAHLAVRDPFWYALVDLAAALFWFNPLVWFARRRFQAACETAADEASLLVQDGAPTLAACLVQLGKQLASVNSYGWIGIEGRRSALWQRVDRLLKLEASAPRALSRRWTVMICFASALASIALLAASAAFGRGGPSLSERLWHLHLAQVPAPAPLTATDNQGLRTRSFRVDPANFEKSVKEFVIKQGKVPADEFVDDLRFFMEAFGVDVRPPTQVFYNPRAGMLMMRAPLKDVDALEQVLLALNAAPAQVVIEAKFVELSDPLDTLELRNFAIGGDAGGTNGFRGILPPSRYRELVKWLEARAGVDILSTPKVTTLSGRQAQIKVVEVRSIVTDLLASGGQTNAPKPIVEPFEFGPVLDVVPFVREDGVSIEMTVITTVREFVGYDMSPRLFDSGPPRPLTPKPIREYLRERETDGAVNDTSPADPLIPLPRFRIRQARSSASVWDGQTLALALEPHTPISKNPNVRYATAGKPCLLFVTPTLIDPAGNRVNNESTLPFVEQNVPK